MHLAHLLATRCLATLFLAVLAPATFAAQGSEDPSARFDAAYERFSEAYRQADPAAVAALYWTDAYYLSPGAEIEQGDVRSHFAWLADMEPGEGPHLSFEIVDREVDGDLGYDIGIYSIRRDGWEEGRVNRGKFIVIWKRGEDGTWKIHADGFSAIRPDE